MVEMLKAFCCPGVGARNPVLAAPRSANPSDRLTRPAIFPLTVVPKSEKRSTRPATPRVQAPSGSRNSRSPYPAKLLRLQAPAVSGPNPVKPLEPG